MEIWMNSNTKNGYYPGLNSNWLKQLKKADGAHRDLHLEGNAIFGQWTWNGKGIAPLS